jgi:4-amino-4-deoxy-L-arabinose transferase-like glycosyltransferase
VSTTAEVAPLAAPALRDARERGRTLALLLVALLPYVLVLHAPPLWDANEPLYAEPPREALETGEWLAPPCNYKLWPAHPPLSTWITMPFYAALGASPFAARLPMALAAMATVLAAYAIAREVFGRRGALATALVLAATPRFWLYSRQLAGDVYFTAILVGAFALALPALRGRGEGRGRILAAHALIGVGTLAKGPVLWVLYVVPLFLAARLARPRVPLSALRPAWFALLAVGLGCPWYLYMESRFDGFLSLHFGWYHARRFFSDDLGGRPPWYYLVALAGDGQPWISLVPFALWRARRAPPRTGPAVLVLAAAAFPFLFFSLAVGKRNVYLMPIYPFVAAIVAPVLLDLWDGVRPALARAAGAVLATAAAVACVFLVIGAGNVPDAIAAGSRPYLVACAAATLALGFAAGKASGRGVVAGTTGSVWVLLVISALSLPTLGRFMPVPRLAAKVVELAKKDEPFVVYATSLQSPMFYARRATTRAQNPAEVLAAIPPGRRGWLIFTEENLPGLAAEPSLALTEIDRAPYFKFQFSWNILDRGKSTRDLLLVRADRRNRSRGPRVPRRRRRR